MADICFLLRSRDAHSYIVYCYLKQGYEFYSIKNCIYKTQLHRIIIQSSHIQEVDLIVLSDKEQVTPE